MPVSCHPLALLLSLWPGFPRWPHTMELCGDSASKPALKSAELPAPQKGTGGDRQLLGIYVRPCTLGRRSTKGISWPWPEDLGSPCTGDLVKKVAIQLQSHHPGVTERANG